MQFVQHHFLLLVFEAGQEAGVFLTDVNYGMEGLDVSIGGGANCDRVKGVSIVKAIVFGTGEGHF